jgi:hypothetical protein
VGEADRPRALIDNTGAQTGDQSYRDTAGRDIHQGADPTAVLDFLRDYVFAADQRRETAHKELSREVRLSRDDMAIMGDALRTVRDRVDDLIVDRDVDKLEREDRQGELDRVLKALRDEQERLRLSVEARSARNRRILFWFAIGLLVALLIGGWLAYDRYTGLALVRVWTGGGAALLYALARGR